MSANSEGKPIVYVESGVFVARFVPSDAHHKDAVRILDAIRRSGYRMITTPLTLMEVFAAIRKKSTMSNKCRTGSEEERAAVAADVENIINNALRILDHMIRQGLRIIVPKDWSPDLFLLCLKVFEHAGYVVPAGKGRSFRYRIVGSCDWFHFALAEYLGAAVICTTDAAFADIAGNDDEFGHILVQMASGPLVGPLAAGSA